MVFTILLALAGLTLSAVAIYYSVIGLTAIFAAAFWPIVVMGATLEISKLVAASWLKYHWHQIPKLMKIYMTTAVVILMLITSMGIFGFLSKAHSDQSLVSGEVTEKIAILDEQIKTERDNIDAARKALAQMDAQVNERLSRSSDDKGAERAVQIRRQQQAERTRLQKDITTAQSNISRLNEQRAPIAAQVRKVEAEVGPIKYIAKFIYGDDPGTNLLEKAVTWVIMIIVFVFDPLAVLMLLSSQMTYQWYRQDQKKKDEVEELTPEEQPIVKEETVPEEKTQPFEPGPWPFMSSHLQDKVENNRPEKESDIVSTTTVTELETELDQDVNIDELNVDSDEKEAMRLWKDTDPGMTIKRAQKLLEMGLISELPWDQFRPSKKKDNLHSQGSESTSDQDQGRVSYIQNSEQDSQTLWQKIQRKKNQSK